MANLNRVFLMGNLTRDPELRYIPSGTTVTTFTLAVNRVYSLPSGEKKEETNFIRTVVWGRIAETCAEYLKKGSAAFVEGRLQTRSWEGQDGQKRSITEVNAQNVQFLNTRGAAPQAPSQVASKAPKEASAKEPLEEISLDLPSDPPNKADGEDVVPF